MRELEAVVESARKRDLQNAERKREHAAKLLAELQEERTKLSEEVEQARMDAHIAEQGVIIRDARDDESIFQAQQLSGR